MHLRPLILLLFLAACTGAAKQGRSYARTDLGRAYLMEGNVESAVVALRQAVKLYPRNWEAWDRLGLAYMQKGKNDEAEQAFKRAIRIAGDSAEPRVNYGVLLFRTERVDEAILQYERALEDITYMRPAIILNNLGYSYYFKGRHEDAERTLAEAVQRAPNYCPARYNLGLVELALEKDTTALAAFEQVIILCPDEALGSYYQAALLYLERGDRERAGEALNLIMQRSPDSEAAKAANKLLQDNGM